MYYFDSVIGTFTITRQGDRSGLWWLGFEGERLGTYDHPQNAADDVAAHRTGWEDWDLTDTVSAPADLSQWERRRVKASA